MKIGRKVRISLLVAVCSLHLFSNGPPSVLGLCDKERESDLRILSYNTEKKLLDPAYRGAFGRILAAISPDVIAFQEITAATSGQKVAQFLNEVLDYGIWNIQFSKTDGYNKTVLAARYRLTLKRTDTLPISSTRGAAIALIDLPDDRYRRDLYVLGVHLKAMGTGKDVAKRQKACDAIAAWLGDARDAPQAVCDHISLPELTPMVVMGDFNFVAGPQPEITLRTGDIQDNATYGPDVKGDWLEVDLIDPAPVNPDNGNANTWPSSQENPTSRIDRFYLTGSAATVVGGFILNTLTMSPADLVSAGLQKSDTTKNASADHLPVVIDLRLAEVLPSASEPVPGDYDGDGTCDLAVFRSTTGLWAVRGVTRAYFGSDNDQPVPEDYDGDSHHDLAIYRASSGLWSVRGITRTYYGGAGYLPIPGDYDGDGTCDLAVFRGSTGLWSIQDLTRVYFGRPDDIPVPGDYNGDGTVEPALFRPSSGLWAVRGGYRFYFGTADDVPVPAFYGGGQDRRALFRGNTGLWAIRELTRFYFGRSTDRPVSGDYTGSGSASAAIFRSETGLWAIRGMGRLYYGRQIGVPATR